MQALRRTVGHHMKKNDFKAFIEPLLARRGIPWDDVSEVTFGWGGVRVEFYERDLLGYLEMNPLDETEALTNGYYFDWDE